MTFSSLYPDQSRPRHGIFVETRLRQLVGQGGIEAMVISPVPWFPNDHRAFGEYAAYARVPAREIRFGLSVLHPRYFLLPKLGMSLAPYLMALAMLPVLRRVLQAGFSFDVIDAHYFYPDGVAATWLGKWLGKPVMVTARGTDINVIPRFYWPRRMIQSAARRCAAMVTVSEALKRALVALGARPESVTVLRNGIDLDTFQPVDKTLARTRIGISGPMLLSVGHLVEAKGHQFAIEALAQLPQFQLLIIGIGPMERRLKDLATEGGVGARVRFIPHVAQDKLKDYYSAANALVLASSREGMPNVVLESLACGTPVIATDVGGIPEVIAGAEAGVLMAERSARALVEGAHRLLTNYPDKFATRRYAERFSWRDTTRGLRHLFERVVAEHVA